MGTSTATSFTKIGVIMRQFFTSREEYISVLQNEAETLRKFYYKPEGSATGHYNTAIGVLEDRIKELQTQARKEPDYPL
jgi:hypothetical protein